MRVATLAAVIVGGAIFALDVRFVRVPHDHDPFYWLSLAICVAGLIGGAYVRRRDRPIRRSADGAGVTAAIRASLGLWDPEKDR